LLSVLTIFRYNIDINMQMIPEVVVKSALLRFQLDGGTKEGNCVLTPPLPWGRTIYQRHGARK